MSQVIHKEIMPDDWVIVWDWRIQQRMLATVIARYGRKDIHHHNQWIDDYGFLQGKPDVWIYDDLVDVRFIHRPFEISKGHFIWGIKLL